ncbi:hypothetical protein [Streptomyces sp. MST-110588]|uniref:hypothetical protein n=1 Tax=Streptomyces sp. MST-110588 TaxID=2833628 RepID=UPI001F5D5CB0|nr:hypothetical protein [Streptomyces sp. MST-110588]UNO41780.1 hypothetical protein KGS77_22335 [Streptomyces sp. MST-110588]
MPSATTLRHLRALPAVGLRLSLPQQEGHRLIYPVGGPDSLATLLMTSPPEDAYAQGRVLLRDLARTLGALHTVPAEGLTRRKYPGLLRLEPWFSRDFRKEGTVRLYTVVRRRLGDTRLRHLRERCRWFLTDTPAPVLLHGRPGTGVVVPDLTNGSGSLLAGEDMAAGRPCLDIGWVLGELAELRGMVRRRIGAEAAAQWSLITRAFADACDRPALEDAREVAVLGMLAHMRDACDYVGWGDEWATLTVDILAEEAERAAQGS